MPCHNKQRRPKQAHPKQTHPIPKTIPTAAAAEASPRPSFSSEHDPDPWSDASPTSNFTADLVYHHAEKEKLSEMDRSLPLREMEASWRSSSAVELFEDKEQSTSILTPRPAAYAPAGDAPVFQSRSSAPGPPSAPEVTSTEPDKHRPPLPPAKLLEILADLIDTSKGRDKVLKCAQYSLKAYLYIFGLVAALRPLSPFFQAHNKRLKTAVSSLSTARKCMILFAPLRPAAALLSPEPMSAGTMLNHLLGFFNSVADDFFCLYKLGLLSDRNGRLADRWANRFWFIDTLIQLYALQLRTIPELQQKLAAAQQLSLSSSPSIRAAEELRVAQNKLCAAERSRKKLVSDFVFVCYDVFNWKYFKEPVQIVAGMTSALISTSTLYDKYHRASLAKG